MIKIDLTHLLLLINNLIYSLNVDNGNFKMAAVSQFLSTRQSCLSQ